MADRALQGNASDPEQIKFATRKVKERTRRRADLVARQLSTVEGREFVWQELERHGIFDHVSGPADEVQRYLGRREAGLGLFQELLDGHADAYLVMHAEAVARSARSDREVAAARGEESTQT